MFSRVVRREIRNFQAKFMKYEHSFAVMPGPEKIPGGQIDGGPREIAPELSAR